MEVHHHPHAEKKGFREYFLEFVMIFLAVTLGFFAESLRENIGNKNRVHEYVQSMVSDLESDIEMYHSYDIMNTNYCTAIDTIFANLNSGKPSTGQVYYLARTLTMLGTFIPSVNTKSYSQMTSTGGLRLIKNQHVADSIASYYQLIKSFDDWSELQRGRVNDLIAINNKLFSANVFFSLYNAMESSNDSLQKIIKSNPPFVTNDPQTLNAVMMYYQYYYGFLKLMIKRTDQAAKQAHKLKDLLEKQYAIKE